MHAIIDLDVFNIVGKQEWYKNGVKYKEVNY